MDSSVSHYRIQHVTKYAYTEPVAVGHNLIRLAPLESLLQQRRSYRLLIIPEPSDRAVRQDAFGNQVDYFSIEEAHRGLTLSATSDLVVSNREELHAGVAWETIRESLPSLLVTDSVQPYQYCFPSTLVPTDQIYADYAKASFTPDRPIVDAIRDLTSRIHRDYDYDPHATTVSTPVKEAFEKRAGVCQDFAHVEIACLRSIGLSARYVSGYLRTLPPPGKPRLVGADASHAWLSVYCGEAGWVDTDPTNDKFMNNDYVTLAYGRDYADVCPIQGVYVGGGNHTMSVSVDVAPVEAP